MINDKEFLDMFDKPRTAIRFAECFFKRESISIKTVDRHFKVLYFWQNKFGTK